MLRLTLDRLVAAALTLLGASVVSFVILRAVPSNPARLIAGPFATDEVIRNVEAELGLDKPIWQQYVSYIWDFAHGDWGFSYSAGQPVLTQMAERLPASAELGLYAFAIALAGALIFALLAALSGSRIVDYAVRLMSFIFLGVAPFWIALILLMVFFEQLGWLPGPGGRGMTPSVVHTGFHTIDHLLNGDLRGFFDALTALLLPALSLALAPMGYMIRLLRANLLDTRSEGFVPVLHARGLSGTRTKLLHILPNAFLPTLTAAGLIFSQLIGGSVLIEKMFSWPGIGTLVTDSILRQDYAVVQAFVLLSAFLYVLVSLAVDILYGVLDPRIRRS